MNASLPIIEVNGLSKRYKLGHFNMTSFREEIGNLFTKCRGKQPSRPTVNKDFWALRDISFSINRGEVVGIIGRNGAGKSTLLKILSRITEPTTGEAVLRGRVASLLEVGTGFHPELSGRENIFLNGAILGMKRAEIAAKFDAIVDFSEIGQFIDTPVKRYSSGMYVRLAFAVAAHLEPEILIVDEVLAVGDAAFQKKCIAKMNEVSGHGRTVIFVSHSMEAIARLCPRCIVLAGGKIAFIGDTTRAIEVYDQDRADDRHAPLETWTSLPAPNQVDYQARISRFRLRNITRVHSSVITTGEHLAIDLELEATRPLCIANLAVMLSTLKGVRLINADTGKLGRKISLQPGAYVFTLNIESLLLSTGDYHLNFYLANTRTREVFHSIAGQHLLRVSPSTSLALIDMPENDSLVQVPFSVTSAND